MNFEGVLNKWNFKWNYDKILSLWTLVIVCPAVSCSLPFWFSGHPTAPYSPCWLFYELSLSFLWITIAWSCSSDNILFYRATVDSFLSSTIPICVASWNLRVFLKFLFVLMFLGPLSFRTVVLLCGKTVLISYCKTRTIEWLFPPPPKFPVQKC